MRILKNILHITLALALLATAFPVLRGDVNLDRRVDLVDAIVSVQGVARSVYDPALFKQHVENALISLTTAAGFQKTLKADRPNATIDDFQQTPVVLAAIAGLACISESGAGPAAKNFLYKSFKPTPLTPPPLSATV